MDGSWVGGAAAAVWEDGPRDMFGGLCAGSKGAGSLSFSCGRSCAGDRSLGSRTSKQEARARGRTQMTHSHPAWGVQPTLGFSGRGCPTAAQALSSDACTLSPPSLLLACSPSTKYSRNHGCPRKGAGSVSALGVCRRRVLG